MIASPLISVITPSFNQAAFIERTIRSVIDQDYGPIEYIVVDGGSTDGTLDILRKYEGRLIWVSEKDKGQADAINKGIKMSTGEIVGYLNSDDIYEEGALGKVAAFFHRAPDMMWMTGGCRIIDHEGREIRRLITAYKNFLLDHYSYSLLLAMNPISQPATFWRRQLVEELGYFDVDEHLVMDYEYWLRAGKKYMPGIFKDGLACFRVHGSSKTQSTNFANFKQELIVASRYSSSRTIRFLHYLNYVVIYFAYSLMAAGARIMRGRGERLRTS